MKRVTGAAEPVVPQPRTEASPPSPPPPPVEAKKTGLDAVVANIPDSLIISTLINGAGTIAVNQAFGVPFDLAVTLTFGALGTLIGASYGPAKQAILDQLAGHSGRAGAPLADPESIT